MNKFMLDIDWHDVPDLPWRVGPFDSREEARDWGEKNIPNGAWMVCELAHPYMRHVGEKSPLVPVVPEEGKKP